MANYPTFLQLEDSSHKPLMPDHLLERAESGKPRLQDVTTSHLVEFTLEHELDLTEVGELRTFYDTNKGVSFNLAYQPEDGTVYLCKFTAAPKVSRIRGSTGFDVSVQMVSVA